MSEGCLTFPNGEFSVVCCLFGPVRYVLVHDVLNLIAKLEICSHCEQICDGLGLWQDKHRQNSFPISAPVEPDLVAAPASHFLYAVNVFRQA